MRAGTEAIVISLKRGDEWEFDQTGFLFYLYEKEKVSPEATKYLRVEEMSGFPWPR